MMFQTTWKETFDTTWICETHNHFINFQSLKLLEQLLQSFVVIAESQFQRFYNYSWE